MPKESRYSTLVDVYDSSVSAHGARNLFGTKNGGRWSWMTYADFASLVERFRGGLASLGVERGDHVAIVSNNRVPWAVAAYACYGLGAAPVPMYEAQHPKDWEFIVRDCEAKVLLVANEQVLGKAKGFLGAIASLKHIVLIDGSSNGESRVTTYSSLLSSGRVIPPIRPSPEDVAALLYTSGTTGNPKGVILTHRNIASNVSEVRRIFPMLPSDRSLSFLPWSHAFGQTGELHTLFAVGASMALCEGVDKILDNLAEVHPTLLISVPTIFNRLYTAVQQQLAARPSFVRALAQRALAVTARQRAGERPGAADRLILGLIDRLVFRKVRARLGGELRFAVSGGAALPREVGEFIDSLGITIFEGYGLTETSPVASVNGPGERKFGSVGRPIGGVHIDIDASKTDHPSESSTGRVEGEIVIHGPNVMKGYFKRPEETAAVLTSDGGFRSGDMGYLDAEGFLFITGRIKEQYKLENGKYVVPSPLEDELKLSPYIANAMVYGDNRPYNVALVVPNVGALRKWGESKQIALADSPAELAKDERVRSLLAEEIRARSSAFKGFERIQDFAMVPGEFTVDNGMLTPKMSLKRRKAIETYGPLIEQLYTKGRTEGPPRRAAAPDYKG